MLSLHIKPSKPLWIFPAFGGRVITDTFRHFQIEKIKPLETVVTRECIINVSQYSNYIVNICYCR